MDKGKHLTPAKWWMKTLKQMIRGQICFQSCNFWDLRSEHGPRWRPWHCQTRSSPPPNSASGFPNDTCSPTNSIKDSSSYLEPVSRADLPGDSLSEKFKICTKYNPQNWKKKKKKKVLTLVMEALLRPPQTPASIYLEVTETRWSDAGKTFPFPLKLNTHVSFIRTCPPRKSTPDFPPLRSENSW